MVSYQNISTSLWPNQKCLCLSSLLWPHWTRASLDLWRIQDCILSSKAEAWEDASGVSHLATVCLGIVASCHPVLASASSYNHSMKSFLHQFVECSKAGFHKEVISEPITPDMLPFCPSKARQMAEAIKKDKITHFTFIKCGRFGGQCKSSHPKCKALRCSTQQLI